MSNPHILPRPQTSDSGFTLLEMLVAIVIMTIFVSILYPVFTQALHTSQESETQARLQELVKGVKVAYEKDAMVVDTTGANGALVFTSDWSQVLGNQNNGTALLTDGSETVTPTQAYPPGRPQDIQSGFFAIAGAAGNSPLHLATDGFGQPIWVFVSPEMETQYDGYPLYYHDVGFLSTNGAPGKVTPATQGVTYTCSVNPSTEQSGCSFQLGTNGGQHDLVANVSGYAIEAHLYQETLQKMQTVAKAYAGYFTTQYLANTTRDVDIDYFANIDTAWDGCGPDGQGGNAYMDTSSTIPNSGNGSNGGPGFAFPGESPDGDNVTYYGADGLNDTQPATWDDNAFINSLGLSESDVTSAWGFLMGVANGPNAPSFDNAIDRDPLSCNSNLQSPPYTAFIFAWAPNAVLLSDSIVGTY
ncbi:hypothetical protein BAE30_14090 [Acidithiobacillus caldus]|nr:hypothetical protein BAE30_14090 [Acidithiobacillus caldus]